MSPAQQSAALRSFEAQWLAREHGPLSAVRERALRRFLHLGLPTARDESWRYTNLRPLAAQSFIDAPGAKARGRADAPGTDAPGALADAPRALGPGAAQSLLGGGATIIVMVNGHPLLPGPQQGLEIYGLEALSRSDPETVAQFLEPLSDAEEARWMLLNSALSVDGLYIRIKSRVDTPIEILHVGSADDPHTAAYPRVIVEALPGSAATLVEHHVQDGTAAPLCNSATIVVLERDAQLEHYRIFATGEQAVHFDTLELRQRKDSRCKQFTIALGGGLVRTALEAQLSEPGARVDSQSLLLGHAERHVDCVNMVKHRARATVSRQTARAIAGGTSRVIFNSKVVVDAGASGSDSRQSCRGLLLSPTAEIDSRPQLEIHTDEVKCAHGATTGRLDPDMLFYMLSRGLDRATAQSLLVYAFLADVLTGMSLASARPAIENAVISQLPDSQTLRKFR